MASNAQSTSSKLLAHPSEAITRYKVSDLRHPTQAGEEKSFRFTGWHPLCRCYATPVLMSNEEFAQSLLSERNGETAPRSANEVTALPDNFKEWVERNKERIEAATNLPYFLKNNQQYDSAIQRKAVEELIRDAKAMGSMLQKTAETVASKFDAMVTPINYKTRESIMRKIKTERAGKPTYSTTDIKDSVRTTIIADRSRITAVREELKEMGCFIKEQDTELGYTGTIANVSGISTMGEIQVNTAKMIYAKERPNDARKILGDALYDTIAKEVGVEGGLGHRYYEEWRVLDKESKAAKAIAKKSRAYYKHFTD